MYVILAKAKSLLSCGAEHLAISFNLFKMAVFSIGYRHSEFMWAHPCHYWTVVQMRVSSQLPYARMKKQRHIHHVCQWTILSKMSNSPRLCQDGGPSPYVSLRSKYTTILKPAQKCIEQDNRTWISIRNRTFRIWMSIALFFIVLLQCQRSPPQKWSDGCKWFLCAIKSAPGLPTQEFIDRP